MARLSILLWLAKKGYFMSIYLCKASGAISTHFNKRALGALSQSGCGLVTATIIFLKMEYNAKHGSTFKMHFKAQTKALLRRHRLRIAASDVQ